MTGGASALKVIYIERKPKNVEGKGQGTGVLEMC